ncbi:MAG: 50S ribosomal protein L10 [Gemmatimonadales bacterium]
MSKTERQAEVETLTAALKASPNVYVTDFTGLNVLSMTEFRRRLRAAGASYIVVKNTLAQRALAANKIEGLDAHFTGPTGLVLSHEPLSAAKVLTEFAKEHGDKPTVKMGRVDGEAVSAAHVKRLGEIPSREVLLAQMAGAMNSVLYTMVGALEALREQRSAAAS